MSLKKEGGKSQGEASRNEKPGKIERKVEEGVWQLRLEMEGQFWSYGGF